MLTVIEKVIFLQNVDLFQGVPTEDLAYLAAIVEELSFLEKDVIFKEHDTADALYLVREGKVRLHRAEEEITVVGPREAFGSWALFDEEQRVATATCLEDTQLLRVVREEFYDLLADHGQITQGVFKSLVTRLRNMLERVDSERPHVNKD